MKEVNPLDNPLKRQTYQPRRTQSSDLETTHLLILQELSTNFVVLGLQWFQENINLVEKVLNEQQKALLKSQEQKKDLRKQLEKSEARNKDLEKELEKCEAQNKELNNIVLDQHTALSSYEDQIKNLKKELDQVGSHESRSEIMTKERNDLISKYNYNQALKQRDSTLAKLNTIGAELQEAQNDLELGKKVWDAERIALAERLSNAKQAWEAEKIALIDNILTKERQDSTFKYNQALKERDTALSELKNLGVKLKGVQKDLYKSNDELESGKKKLDMALNELKILGAQLNGVQKDLSKSQAKLEFGKKVWEAEKMELTKKLNRFGTEIKEIREELSDLAKIHEKHIQENENAYCAGYLTGWFREPHEYVSLRSHEAKEVALPVHKPLEATSSLSHSRALIRRFGSAGP
ncbi:intracellular protein transport protein uso1-like [Rosa rugosa]|uniref:intracellular protein transport protein uso1-like n=1 Tax=Rosa rugosa TaxID=74645 RepID=UPI002B409ABC|nr:intracellular protein transport protein uso1-like [Rosa rugosa]